MNEDAKFYNEVCDDAQHYIDGAIKKLEKAHTHLQEKGFDIAADRAAELITYLKTAATNIDSLPALGDD